MVSFRIPWNKGFKDDIREGMNFALCGAKLTDFMAVGFDKSGVFIDISKFVFNTGL